MSKEIILIMDLLIEKVTDGWKKKNSLLLRLIGACRPTEARSLPERSCHYNSTKREGRKDLPVPSRKKKYGNLGLF
jgi:hypothetical protein